MGIGTVNFPSKVRVFAPATVANVACAFDVIGFSVHNPGDEVTVWRRDDGVLKIERIVGDEGRLPLDSRKNSAAVSIQSFLNHIGAKEGVSVELTKGMSIGSGLGSSSASSVAGVLAVNELFGSPLSREELVQFAMEGERIACGTAHADNVAPALLGGFVLIRSYQPLDIIRLQYPADMYCSLVSPQVEVKTEDARKILRREVLLADAVKQWGNVAGLVAGLHTSDYGLIGRSLQDVIIEPARGDLIPCFFEAKQAALACGVLGCSISGSGPSIFALSRDECTAKAAIEAMEMVYSGKGIQTLSYCSKVNAEGAKVVERMW